MSTVQSARCPGNSQRRPRPSHLRQPQDDVAVVATGAARGLQPGERLAAQGRAGSRLTIIRERRQLASERRLAQKTTKKPQLTQLTFEKSFGKISMSGRCFLVGEFAMMPKRRICIIATVFALASTSAYAVVPCTSPSCIVTQTSWSAQQSAGLDEQPTTNSDSGTGPDLPYSKRITSPSDMEQTYVGTAKTKSSEKIRRSAFRRLATRTRMTSVLVMPARAGRSHLASCSSARVIHLALQRRSAGEERLNQAAQIPVYRCR